MLPVQSIANAKSKILTVVAVMPVGTQCQTVYSLFTLFTHGTTAPIANPLVLKHCIHRVK